MSFQLDIYELENGHIHVAPRGDAKGMIDFANSEIFEAFVNRCREFIENNRHAKKTMDLMVEQDQRVSETRPSDISDPSGKGDH
jgi:hypothetical protein